MVVRTATQSAFCPEDRPRLAIASDGTLAAIHEPARVSVIELPGAAAFAEVGIAADASESDVAWVGAPPRLVVLSRYAAHSTVHLLDPYGPRTIAEIRLEGPMRLCATVGPHALAVGTLGAAVLTATDSRLMPYQFPARAVPVAAGSAAGQFVVALSGAIEEWDPQSRMPRRRIKLARPGAIRAVGGSDRVVWWMTQADPARIEVSPLVNRGQPKAHELPEPIAQVAAHPRSDLLACVGAESGRLYVVDLDGRAGLRVVGPEGIDRAEAAALVVGRVVGVLAAQARRAVTLVSLDRREREAEAAAPAASVAPPAEPDEPEEPAKPSTLYDEPPTAVTLSGVVGAPLEAAAPGPPAGTPVSGAALAQRLSAWRERAGGEPARAVAARVEPAPAVAARVEPAPRAPADERPTWRDAIAYWARAVGLGTAEREPPPAARLDELLARFALPRELLPAFALLYGAHLCGEPGAAPIAIARVLGHRWDDALGKGELAARGVAVYRDSRVRLAPAVQRALDELPPRTGALVGTPGATRLAGPHVLVAPDGPLVPVAEACLASVGGAILAAHPHADPHEVVLEARAYGAVAMLRAPAGGPARGSEGPIVLVAADDAAAGRLGVPRLA